MNAKFDAIIIGAGVAGSTCAILLARAGWRVALVEKYSFPRRKVCGECIAAGNFHLLNALGVGAAVAAAAGPPLRQVGLMRGNHGATADLPAASDAQNPWGRALGRDTLDTLLMAQAVASGASAFHPCAVQRLAGSVGYWHCEIRAANSKEISTLHAPVVIDAHGSWESWRSGGARPVAKGSDLLAFKANFHNAALQPGLLPVLLFRGGYGGMVLAERGITTLACCIRRDRLNALRMCSPGISAGEAVEAMLKRECEGVQKALATASREGPWLAAGPINPGIRVRPDDTVFRVGNAAGEAHPIIGEGMSMALQSAWLLCAHLTRTDRNARPSQKKWQSDVAKTYAADWRCMFRPRLRIASVFAQLALRPVTAPGLMALVEMWPGLLTQSARWAGKAGTFQVPVQRIPAFINPLISTRPQP